MIKNILMFRTNDASFGQFNFVVDFMAAEYEKLGCHVDFVDIMTDHFGEELIDKLNNFSVSVRAKKLEAADNMIHGDRVGLL